MMKLWKTIKRKWNEIVWESEIKSSRFSIVIGSLFWGILLMWPGELFTPARTTYRLMSQIACENCWSVAFLAHAGFAATTLFTNLRTKLLFFCDALFGAVLWTAATVACFASHWQIGVPYAPPAAMSAELALMLASWWWCIRWIVAEQHKKEDQNA